MKRTPSETELLADLAPEVACEGEAADRTSHPL
jgi:hypothetical protein